MTIKLAALMLLVLIGAPACAPPGAGVSARIEIASAPPAPQLTFLGVPEWRYLQHEDVYVLADESYGYDVFRVGGWFYLYSEGYWYRASEPRGPYVAVEVRRVPGRILRLRDDQYHWHRRPQAWRQHDQDDDQGDHENNHR